MYSCPELANEVRETLNGTSCVGSNGQVNCNTAACTAACGNSGCDGSTGRNICCNDASSTYNAELRALDPPDLITEGSFNCFDGDPNNPVTDSTGTTIVGGGDAYYGNETTVQGYNYMCIKDFDSTTPSWTNPEDSTYGAAGGAPLCPSARRLMKLRMEELFSSYEKHNSKVQLIQPPSYKSSETKTSTEEVDKPKDDDIPSCRMGVPVADVRRLLSADQCNPSATPEKLPLDIISRSGKTVTFTLSQVWKQCSGGGSIANNMDWIAADFVVPENGELECFKTSRPDCGIVNAFTAKCTEGLALIDIYAVDETATGVFYQTDGSALTIPDACAAGGKKGDTTKACKFRYVLNCMDCENDKETSSWWTSDSLWRKLTDAFRRGWSRLSEAV